MKIALVMVSLSSGGIQMTVAPYALALMGAGHDVLAVIAEESPLRDHLAGLGIPLTTLMFPPLNPDLQKLRMKELGHHLRQYAPDLIIAFAGLGLPQVRAAVGRAFPVISRCGDTSPDVIKPLLQADHLIATSDDMARGITALGYRPDRISVLPNFFQGEAVAHDYAPRPHVRIGAMGRLVRRKGFTDLIEALAQLRKEGLDFEAEIAGDGRDAALIRAQAQKAEGVVTMRPWIDGAEKDAFLRSLDILVVPSRDEPFGNVLLEGMQYGLPIVSTRTTGAHAIFAGRGFMSLVEPRHPAGLAREIRRLAQDPAERRRIGEIGQTLWREEYTLAHGGPKLVALVERVLPMLKGA